MGETMTVTTNVPTNDTIHGLFKKIALADDVPELQGYIERGKRILPVERYSEMMFSVFRCMYVLSAVEGLESVMDEAADYLKKRGESYRLCRDYDCSDEFFTRVVAHPVFGKTNLDLTYCTPAQLQIYLTTGVPKTVNNFLHILENCVPSGPIKCKMTMEIYRLFGANPNFPTVHFMDNISIVFNQRCEDEMKLILESDVGITPNTQGHGGFTLLDWYVTPNQLRADFGKRKDMTLEFGRYLLEKGAVPRNCSPGRPDSNALYWLRESVKRREVNAVAMFYLFKGPVITWTEMGIGHDKDSSHRIEVDPVSGLIHYQELSIAGVKDITGKVRVVGKQTEIYKEVETLPADRVIVNPDGTYTIIEVLAKLNETFGL